MCVRPVCESFIRCVTLNFKKNISTEIFLPKIFMIKIYLLRKIFEKIYWKKYFHQKYFHQKYFQFFFLFLPKIHLNFFNDFKTNKKNMFARNISPKNTLAKYISKKKGAKPLCCPQGLG